MKIYQVVISEEARYDLDSIYDYIAFEFENPIGADKVINAIINKCIKLSMFPKASAIRYTINKQKLRFTRAGKYTIIYYVDDKDSVVYVKTIVYSRADIFKKIKK